MEKPINIAIKYSSLSPEFTLARSFSDSCFSIVSSDSFYLPPHSFVHVIKFEIELSARIDDNLIISGNLGSENSPCIQFKLHNSRDNLNELYDELIQNESIYSTEQKDEVGGKFLTTEILGDYS